MSWTIPDCGTGQSPWRWITSPVFQAENEKTAYRRNGCSVFLRRQKDWPVPGPDEARLIFFILLISFSFFLHSQRLITCRSFVLYTLSIPLISLIIPLLLLFLQSQHPSRQQLMGFPRIISSLGPDIPAFHCPLLKWSSWTAHHGVLRGDNQH